MYISNLDSIDWKEKVAPCNALTRGTRCSSGNIVPMTIIHDKKYDPIMMEVIFG